MPGPDHADDTALLVAALREAGEIARRFYFGAFKIWYKSPGNPVTEADIAVDAFLKDTLLAARPDYSWMSEESEDDGSRVSRPRGFVVDPIDGTYGFLKRRPQFTIVAAIVENGRPVSGAIYNPVTEEMFEAAVGAGAKKDGQFVKVSKQSDFENLRMLAEGKFVDPNRWTRPWPASVISETRASSAYRMGLVAAGEFDAMVSLSAKSDWDVAAGDLIVNEAGGRVTTREGDALLYNREHPIHRSIVCAGPALHEKLLTRITEMKP